MKLELHLYVCRDCGCGRENALVDHGRPDGRGDWETTYTLPDGTAKVLRHVPPCEPGPLTATVLEIHAAPIAAWKGHRHAIDMRPAAAGGSR